jgi:hypothetical protein
MKFLIPLIGVIGILGVVLGACFKILHCRVLMSFY